ncbi:glycoside hydrolase family 97 C-terminal domain-containing protein [Streptomyces sp. NBC_00876]|uniref:glycoside hydrolase family 97 C-terminal domain-containing protein n=1 Tax=Streptomyces sp. NBC_00876 TaxID=2975853 RepID=UPI00386C2E7B|nr:glycoside hydrolase family 97 C-terminal domain-containing protein [Streptomyces sp. NBC_00876]
MPFSDYQVCPEAQRWMCGLPTVWGETQYVSGDPRTGAVIARHNGDDGFVGALKYGDIGTISYPTAFLGSGTWRAEIITVGPSGGLVHIRKAIRTGVTLGVPVVTNGGHVVKLTKVAP